MNFKGEDLLVGLVALALLPLIAARIVRGLRSGRLSVYRTTITRADDPARFRALAGLHMLSFAIVAVIAADLLLRLDLKARL